MLRLEDGLRRNSKVLVDVDNGFRYTKIRSSDELTFWRCKNRDTCKGSVTTNHYSSPNLVITNVGHPHSHAAEDAEILMDRHVRGIKRRAMSNPNEPPAKIIDQELVSETNEEVLMRMPQRRNLLRSVSRYQNLNRPAIPSILNELEIIDPYNKTLEGERFLLYDSGVEDEDRLIIYATDDDLRRLCASEVVYCDGTFKCAPRLFKQLFTIHAVVFGEVFPLVYAITTRQNQATYVKIIEVLKERTEAFGLSFSPRFVSCDFEKATLNAIESELPQAEIRGCLFHFSQSVQRYGVLNCGLKVNRIIKK